MSKDAPIASLLRVERGIAAPEELAAIAVVVACYAGRTSGGGDEAGAAGPGRPRTPRAAPRSSAAWMGSP
ncbi:acyl-CoA carboxylase epsilon subunit, partial [Streptomyces sp. NPDC054946]